ncbi:MAG: hypothetical protein KC729_04950 [Candidatus Eisenbacteria bacterium]|uniref:Porin family protein n=1 Tax=Eiseniibacteriota bacterium TaxID=2212470 RepID=A0A956LZC6_UNCEI|nr:hypothetical protein [Candidatus Eisenbacteria bacterium]
MLGKRAWPLVLLFLAGLPRFAPAQSSPSDIFVNEDAEEEEVFEPLRGFTGYGMTMGVIRLHGGEVTKGAKVRPVLQGDFRYRFSDRWIGKGEFGFGWNGFDARADTVLAVTYGTLGALREFRDVVGLTLRAGVGLGMYRWNYKNGGKSVRDPVTQRFYRGFVPGGYVGLEGEHRLTRHVTYTLAFQEHVIMTGADRYQSLFNEDIAAWTARLGVHYHFSPYEGIIWERKVNRKISLTSGRADK